MRNLVLNVDPAGEVSGSGDDCVGSLTITGNLSAEVVLVKQYVRRHSLLYVGTNSGEGIFGTWQVPEAPAIPGLTSGRFALFPTKESSSDCAAITIPSRARMTATTTASSTVRGM
jgi:hypothetical protein